MPRLFLTLPLALILALPANAEGFVPIAQKTEFLSLVEGRELSHALWQIRLDVRPDGSIEGSALGWAVTGQWEWQDGYFCREMDWSGTLIPYNCQLVEVKDDKTVRFTVDKGEGDSAAFRLR
jgi:hypothetical protein